ncbi:substrate-binding protein [Sporobacter termitidis DSM 10068]|uniref:Substrate-binding protein n=1 Tax=Sporobacter termitidis DSM 10068 TaxID=1123282 RepID=A0A1M5Z3D4_9FIRM|nr:ABC transporter substrate-binding protein [Sporobacter termitidis]SHI18701.1 substrate-binding protein [Sporobacter termitidis DSM 10068]
MKKLRTKIALLLAAVLLVGVLTGCAGNANDPAGGAGTTAPVSGTASPAATEEPRQVELTDLMGNTVTVPSPSNLKSYAITSWKGAFGASILLGQTDKIAAMCDTTQYPWLRYAFPELADIPDYGSFDDVNTEQLLKANADVIISPSSAAKTNEKLQSLGMTVLVDGVNIDNPKDVFQQSYAEIDLVAKLTGTTAVADKYYAWANGIFDLVSARVKDIPDSGRIRVLPIRSDMTQVYGNNCVWGYVVEMAGGINLSADSTASTGKFFVDVDAEQIVKWDPDYIFQINMSGNADGKTLDSYKAWAADQRYAKMKAIQSGDVYLIPSGIEQWDCATEAPLCVLWMAKVMYPDLFKDIDVKAYAEQFYATFLNYKLTDADWKIIAPQYDGAKSNGLT